MLGENKEGCVIAGKTLEEWERDLDEIGILKKISLGKYNKDIGVYYFYLEDELVYIGRAIEYKNGGFRKRLSDYTRKSNSGRKNKTGQKIHDYSHLLVTKILCVGRTKEDVDTVKKLERELIKLHTPSWNKRIPRKI